MSILKQKRSAAIAAFLLIAISSLALAASFINPDNHMVLKQGAYINFTDARPRDPGVITVKSGVLEVQFYDGSWGYVGAGKYPVLQINAVEEAEVYIDLNRNKVTTEGPVFFSGTCLI